MQGHLINAHDAVDEEIVAELGVLGGQRTAEHELDTGRRQRESARSRGKKTKNGSRRVKKRAEEKKHDITKRD